jgi:sugar phosphate isomerase/epimerase
MAGLPLAGCTFGWLHQAPLADALRELAARDVRAVELTTAPPHLFTRHFGRYERKDLARFLRGLGIQVVSVNPSYADINLVSTNPEIREISERQLAAEIELAADLGAGYGYLAQEDPVVGVARLGEYLGPAHVSDTWRARWAHTSVGRGEVDFAGFAAALAAAGFTGPTVYELVDGEDPAPRLAADFAALGKAGWELS